MRKSKTTRQLLMASTASRLPNDRAAAPVLLCAVWHGPVVLAEKDPAQAGCKMAGTILTVMS
jgi:hypothetical protein